MFEMQFDDTPPDTDDVLRAYLAYGNPEYGNPDAQAAWEAQESKNFYAWLASEKAQAVIQTNLVTNARAEAWLQNQAEKGRRKWRDE